MKYPKFIWLMDMGDIIAWCDEPDPNGDGLISEQYIKYSEVSELRKELKETQKLLHETREKLYKKELKK